MKRKSKIVMIVALIGILFMIPVQTKATTQNSLRSKLEANISETIRKFIYADMNGDGKKEAFAITSKYEEDLGYLNAKIWYITQSTCKEIATCDGWYLYPDSVKAYKLKKTRMVTFNVGAGGSGGLSYAYIFKGNQAYTVDGIGAEITYLGKNQFEITDSQFDNFKDGSGHTWNKYYAKWDGTKFVEYGGLKISQTQLKKAKNGAKILRQIKKKGKIGSIYYRANGMVFINYTTEDANLNVALKLKNGILTYYYKADAYGKTKLEKATNGGIIHKAITKCVKYPKKFPVE